MSSKIREQEIQPSIVPIDAETYAMLDYAESPEAKAKIERARAEVRSGGGILPTTDYFVDLNRRISKRRKNADPQEA